MRTITKNTALQDIRELHDTNNSKYTLIREVVTSNMLGNDKGLEQLNKELGL